MKSNETCVPWHFTRPEQLPHRTAGIYTYLHEGMPEYWMTCLDVAHALLEKHQQDHGNETYFQNTWREHFVAALPDALFGEPLVLFDGSAPDAICDRKTEPNWVAFHEAVEGLKHTPRGSIALISFPYHGQVFWQIRIHAGAGHVHDCMTMPLTGPKPTIDAVRRCLLDYEGYTARKEAERERMMLASFARIRELDLRPGRVVRNYESFIEGRRMLVTYTVKDITSSGYIIMTDGRVRGSPRRFETTVPAIHIDESHVAEPTRNPTPPQPVDTLTRALF